MAADVLVIGAGPTGLALACGLRAAGIEVRVLDAADGPATTSRAQNLQPRGSEVLRRLGALGDLPERAVHTGQIVVFIHGRRRATLRIARWQRPDSLGVLMISQAKIEAALRNRLTALGGTVEWGRTVTGLDIRDDGVTARLGDGTAIRSGWVVGADGAHSVVRAAAGIGFAGASLVERFLLADVHTDLDRSPNSSGTWFAWLGGAHPLIAVPLPDGDLWRLFAPPPPGMPADPEPAAIVAHLSARLAADAGRTVRSAEWTSMFGIQRRLASAYRHGRVLLAGDAAHIHSPLGGQGLNTGIGDAENLAWKLALVVTGRADPRLLDTYAAERRPLAENVVASTSFATVVANGRGRVGRLLRDRVAVPLLNTGWLQRRIVEKTSQLTVSYRRGPLGASGRLPLRGLRAGDRVPDRRCVGADGSEVRLHDVLGPQWALSGSEQLAEIARDRLGDVVSLRGDGPSMLVRPDGHLAWRGSDAPALRAWLDRTLGAKVG
ncbi:MAG TPA: FAD-dependent monooxygenase [Mycobacterium sp.]|nr:FAD-dependent monooxygenase [Mycobacterium sp.]